ncbi:DUF427 domain-containing protein [Streptomyces sp. NPDC052107]|uniref:DUF427 domain-containing protein n=1 Tax=Streptomyces sp. NPDC052107 TaxID=3155632 RepID=UPI0034360BD5
MRHLAPHVLSSTPLTMRAARDSAMQALDSWGGCRRGDDIRACVSAPAGHDVQHKSPAGRDYLIRLIRRRTASTSTFNAHDSTCPPRARIPHVSLTGETGLGPAHRPRPSTPTTPTRGAATAHPHPDWSAPWDCPDETQLRPVEGQTFCPYKGLCDYYDIGDARRAAWSYANAYREVDRISDLVSFEADKAEVRLDGTRLHLEPGQNVVPHGVDRGLDADEGKAHCVRRAPI